MVTVIMMGVIIN